MTPFSSSLRKFSSRQQVAIIHWCILCAFVVIAYFPALHTPFIYDDIPNIVLNPFVQPRSFAEILHAVASDVSASRPLALLTFAINFLIGGLDVYGYHVFNLGVHIVNAWVLYSFMVALYSIPRFRLHEQLTEYDVRNLAFLSALLWAVNPVQYQAVTYIVQRMTSLATLFYLLAMLAFLNYRTGRLSVIWISIIVPMCFIAGMACKEIVITLPVCLILMERMLINSERPLNLKWIVSAMLCVLVISTYYIHDKLQDFYMLFPNRNFNPYERLLTESRVLWYYLSLLLAPLPDRLHLEYDFAISRSLFEPVSTLICIISIFTVLISSWLLLNKKPLLAFSIVFYFLASVVEASFLNLGLVYLHRLYLPSLFVFCGLLLSVPPAVRKYAGPVFLVISALYTYGTLQRNAVLENNVGLWKVDYTSSATPGIALINGSISLVELGRYDEAIKLLQPILTDLSDADRSLGQQTLGLANYYKGEYTEALSIFRNIPNNYGDYDQVLFYTGLSLMNTGLDATQQITELEQVFADHPFAAILAAEQLRRSGKKEQAAAMLKSALSEFQHANAIEMNMIRAYLANVYLDMKQYPNAYALYLEIIKLDPDAYFGWLQIYAMQVSAGDLEHATVIKRMLESKGVVVPVDALVKVK